MVELERSLRSLVEHPIRLPEPMEELERRVAVRQRQRARKRAAALVVVLAVLGSLPVLAGLREGDTVVDTGPIQQPVTPTTLQSSGPSRVQAIVPSGWEQLHAEGERLVVATRPLSDRDLRLALLARDDVVFGSFPADAVVFVVGSDRFVAKYTLGEVGRTVTGGKETIRGGITGTPGPANGLGEEKVLAGGVRVRRGDVPRSGVLLAAYAGPRAPAERMAEAESIAASVRLQAFTGPVPPPPPGPPGFDSGVPKVPEERMQPVAATSVGGLGVGLLAAEGCAVVRIAASQQSIGGGCRDRPSPEEPVSVVSSTLAMAPPPFFPGGPGPGSSAAPVTPVVVVVRVAPEVRTVRALLVDGGTVDAVLGPDGWGLVATAGRPYLLEAYDGRGRVIAETAVS